MGPRCVFKALVACSAATLLGIACSDDSSMPVGPAAGAGAPADGPEFVPAPSFDACYPWKKGDPTDPPIFQLFAERPPASHLMILPGHSMLRASDEGWDANFDDAEFARLWELGKLARQQHPTVGEDLAGGDPVTYLMSIGCGDFYRWHVTVSEAFATSESEDAAAHLANQLFHLARNPPPDAIR